MADDRCPACNALFVLVGYRHRCVPRRSEPAKDVGSPKYRQRVVPDRKKAADKKACRAK